MQERPTTNSGNDWMGTLCLVIGVLSLGSGHFFGVAAWLLGNSVMQQHNEWDEQYRQARLGRTLGIIATVLHTLFILGVIAFYVLIFGVMAVAPHH